jgi:hypothetical protein
MAGELLRWEDTIVAGGGVRARGDGEGGGAEKTAANAAMLAAAGFGGDTTTRGPGRCCVGETGDIAITAAVVVGACPGGGLLRFGGGVRASGGGEGGGVENLAARAATLLFRRDCGDGNGLAGAPCPGESATTGSGSVAARAAGAGSACAGDAVSGAAGPADGRTVALRAPADANEADTPEGTRLASGTCLMFYPSNSGDENLVSRHAWDCMRKIVRLR